MRRFYLRLQLADVKAINGETAALEPALKLKGQINAGLTAARENSDTKSHHFDGKLVVRTEKSRYTLGVGRNRSEDEMPKCEDTSYFYANP